MFMQRVYLSLRPAVKEGGPGTADGYLPGFPFLSPSFREHGRV